MTKPSQVGRMVDSCIDLRMPFFLSGPVGAGKSQVVKQRCDARKMGFSDTRISQMDPTDIKGFPNPDAVNNVMRWFPPDFLPPMLVKGKPNTTHGMVFLDELVSAPPATQAVCYQLLLDFKVGSYELPENWCIGSAGNRMQDRSIVNRMPAALANRLLHIDYEIDTDELVAHAMAKGVSSDVIAFWRFKTALVHSFDASVNPAAFPTPRSWFDVDRIYKKKYPASDQHALIAGKIGQGPAAEFKAFTDVIKDLPTIDEIKVSPDSTHVPDSPATLHALVTSLSMATTKTGFGRFMQYVERMEEEWQVVFVRDCLKRINEVKFDPVFTKWSINHADVIL